MRVLLSEGSSLSARESLTALAQAGHTVGVLDADSRCLCRFSRYCESLYRCPPFGADPEAYLERVRAVLGEGRFEVLYPAHEQAYLFARFRDTLPPSVHVALPSFDAMEQMQSKVGFARVLQRLGLSTPPTAIAHDVVQLREAVSRFPVYLKTAYGTANAGTYLVRTERELASAARAIAGSLGEGVVVQSPVAGALERAQAVFADGRLAAFHTCRQVVPGEGGGDFIKESVARPLVREELARMGEDLRWHGGLSVDYILDPAERRYYIDANPRLAEIGNALLAGVNLADALVRVSVGEPVACPESVVGVRSHMAIQGLLGAARHRGARSDVCRAMIALARRSGELLGSREELTPGTDPLSWLAVLRVGLAALFQPRSVERMARDTVEAYAASPTVIALARGQLTEQEPEPTRTDRG